MAKGKPKMDFSRVSRGLQEKKSEQAEETSAKNDDIVTSKQDSGSTSDLVKKMSALHHSQASSSYDIKNIPIDKIRTNPKNDYPMVLIDRLAQTILVFGLIEPLEVIPESDGYYKLESGERRLTAIKSLINQYSDYTPNGSETDQSYDYYRQNIYQFEINGVPCVVASHHTDELWSQIRLNIANLEKRPDDPIFLAQKTKEMADLYGQLNEQLPKNLRFNVNEKLAEDMSMSTRQIIRNKQFGSLKPELQEKLSSITGINEGAKYHVLDADEQKYLSEIIDKTGSAPDVQMVRKMYQDDLKNSQHQNDLADSENDSASAPDELQESSDTIAKNIALKKSAEVKSAVRSLKKDVKKIQAALDAYREISPDIIEVLALDDTKTITKSITDIIKDLKLG